MEILFVGASSAAVRAGEETACYLINGKNLIDTGWNAAVTMQEFGAQATDVDHVLFAHCHQDHTLGLPGVFFANRQRPSDVPLHLYGPMDLPVVCAGAKALLQADRYPQAVPAHEVQLVYPGDGGAAALASAKAVFPAVRLGEKGMRVRLQGPGKLVWD